MLIKTLPKYSVFLLNSTATALFSGLESAGHELYTSVTLLKTLQYDLEHLAGNLRNLKIIRKTMDINEAMKILDVSDLNQLEKRYAIMKDKNDPKSGGSPYLAKKIDYSYSLLKKYDPKK